MLKTFALSRIWYLAALLHIRDSMINKINGVMGKFIWNRLGRFFRVSLDELKLLEWMESKAVGLL